MTKYPYSNRISAKPYIKWVLQDDSTEIERCNLLSHYYNEIKGGHSTELSQLFQVLLESTEKSTFWEYTDNAKEIIVIESLNLSFDELKILGYLTKDNILSRWGAKDILKRIRTHSINIDDFDNPIQYYKLKHQRDIMKIFLDNVIRYKLPVKIIT